MMAGGVAAVARRTVGIPGTLGRYASSAGAGAAGDDPAVSRRPDRL